MSVIDTSRSFSRSGQENSEKMSAARQLMAALKPNSFITRLLESAEMHAVFK